MLRHSATTSSRSSFHSAVPFRRASQRGVQLYLYLLIGALIAVDTVWCHEAGLIVGGWQKVASAIAVLAAVAAFYRRRSRRLSDTAESAALWTAFSAAGCVFTYLCATPALPLHDAQLLAIDQAMRFDWQAWRAIVAARPALQAIFFLAYMSLLPQIMLAAFFFPAAGMTGRGYELLLLALATLVPTALIAAAVPVLGPFATFGGEAAYLPHLLALRAPGPWHFDLTAMEGIISMPSYHTILAMLFTYAFRGIPAAFPPVAALNLLMLFTIPPIGGHYLIDMIAGAAIAGVAIIASRNLAPAT